MDHDFYSLFSAYWWLLFPLGWGVAVMFKSWMRHKRAQQALEVIQVYAQQGKEIPPDVLRVLQQPEKPGRSPMYGSRGFTLVGFFCAALAIAFPVLIAGHVGGNDPDAFYGMLFVAVLMAGFAAAFFLTGHLLARDSKRLDPP
ncbi:MAG TPA: hypothetical protein VNW15_02340 [Rhizomicrobium sp.]|jgi:hypothetical protein|nr:hypothetical protein [Rhizomicrobium sp.]